MNKDDVIQQILRSNAFQAKQETGKAFAPSNIALCKYWGKRDDELNLPVTSSLSISLGDRGCHCSIKTAKKNHVIVNQEVLPDKHEFTQRLSDFLNLFSSEYYEISFEFNIPVAAGVASSACSFAALVMGLNNLYQWHLSKEQLSILARLGSGSACRSLWHGFVKWEAGLSDDGMDSHGILLNHAWPELCVGLLIVSDQKKSLSSREAMKQTVKTSVFYQVWPEKAAHDLLLIEKAIKANDFEKLGEIAESNALAMHAMMMASTPSIIYSLPETLLAMHKIWNLRKQGLSVFFTQDAGANLKLLFLEKDTETLLTYFPDMELIQPFRGHHS